MVDVESMIWYNLKEEDQKKENVDFQNGEFYEFEIPTNSLDEFMKRIIKLNKKLEKNQVGKISIEFGEEKSKIIERSRLAIGNGNSGMVTEDVKILVLTMRMKFEGELKLSDWAVIRVKDNEQLIHSIENVENVKIPKIFWNREDMFCEHCNTNRNRKQVVFLKNIKTGEYKQVGKTCLKDFTGHGNPLQIAKMFEELYGLFGFDWFGGNPKQEEVFDLIDYVEKCSSAIREFGFQSKSSGAFKPTSCRVNEDYSFISVSEKDKENTKKALEWIRSIEKPDNEYIYNLNKLCNKEFIRKRDTGYVASLFVAYKRANNEDLFDEKLYRIINKETGEEISNDFLGEEKKKIEIDVELIKNGKYIDYYDNVNYYMIFNDQNGNELVLFTTSYDLFTQISFKDGFFKIKATVKKHNEKNGRKQTVIKNVKLL